MPTPLFTNTHTPQMEHTLQHLIGKLLDYMPQAGKFSTDIHGLQLTRWDTVNETDTCFYAPSIGLILQGQKESTLGNKTYTYGAYDCLVNGVDMPSLSRILQATPQKPLLAVSLYLEKNLAAELAAEIPAAAWYSPGQKENREAESHCLGVSIARVQTDVLDTFARLVDLLDTREQIPFMAPLLKRELTARVLMGPQGKALKFIFTQGSHSHQVAQAITWLRAHYTEPLLVEALAARVNMPVSSFHRQFKKVTSLSPLQFQKCLRLYEARRLMLSETTDAGHAGLQVGYDSPQQFTREYKRLFGQPPHRDIQHLRNT